MLVRARPHPSAPGRPLLRWLFLALLLGVLPGSLRPRKAFTLQARPSLTVKGQIGGANDALLVAGDVAWIAEGPRVVGYGVAASLGPADAGAALPRLGASPVLPGIARDLAMVGEHLVVAAGPEAGLLVLDIADPQRVRQIGRLDTPGEASGLAALGSVVAVADGEAGLLVVDLAIPSAPAALASVALESAAARVRIAAGHAVVALGLAPWQSGWPGAEGALAVVDLRDPLAPVVRASLDPGGAPLALAAEGDLAYAVVRRRADGERPPDEALAVVDVLGPGDGDNEPRLLGVGTIGDALVPSDLATGLAPHGRYVLAGGARLRVVDLYDPAAPVLLRRLDTPAAAIALSPAGAVLALPGGGIALHATGRGGQLYHHATRSAPGSTVAALPWPAPAPEGGGGDPQPAPASAVGMADRHGLWRVDLGSEAPGELAATSAPYRVAGGQIQRAVSYRDQAGAPAALLLIQGGVAGAHVDTVALLPAPTEDEASVDPDAAVAPPAALGRGAWRSGLPPADLAVTEGGGQALVLDSAEVVAGSGALSLHVVDVSEASRPRTVSAVPAVAGSALTIEGEFAYVLGNDLSVWSLAVDPRRPSLVSRVGGPADTLAVATDLAFTHDGDTLRVFDLSDPAGPEVGAGWPMRGPAHGLAADDRYVAVAMGEAGVALVEFAASPPTVARFDTAGEAVDVHIKGDRLWVADGDGGLLALAIETPGGPEPTPTPIQARTAPRTHEGLSLAVTAGRSGNVQAQPEVLPLEGTRSASAQRASQTSPDPILIDGALGGSTTAVYADDLGGIELVARGARIEVFGWSSNRGFEVEASSGILPGIVRGLTYAVDADLGITVFAAVAGHGMAVLSESLELVALLPLPDAVGITRVGDVLWVAGGSSGAVYGVDVSDRAAPRLLTEIAAANEALALTVQESSLIVAQGDAGISIHDISNPARPRLLSRLPLQGRAQGLDAADHGGGFLLVAAGRTGVHGVSLLDPSNPFQAWTAPQPVDPPVGPVGEAVSVLFGESRLLVGGAFNPAMGGAGLRALEWPDDLFGTEPPQIEASLSLPGEVFGFMPSSDGFLATGSGGLVSYELYDLPDARLIVTHVDAPPGFAGAVAVDDEDRVWLGEHGDQPGVWRAAFGPDGEARLLDGVTLPLLPKTLSAAAGRAWALLEGDLLRALTPTSPGAAADLPDGDSSAALGRRDVLPAPGAVALDARGHEVAWVAPAPEGDLDPDLRLVGIAGPRDLAVTRRQVLPGAARDVALPSGEGTVLVAGDDAGLLAIQLGEVGRTPIVWDGALNAPAAHVAEAGDTVWVDDGQGRLHRLWLEQPALPKLLGAVDLPGGAPLRDLSAGTRGAWMLFEDGAVGFVDATAAITQTSVITRSLPASALQIAAMSDGDRAVVAAGEAGWIGLRSPLAGPPVTRTPTAVPTPTATPLPPGQPRIYLPKAER